jgi:hypothetical protein
MEIAARIRTPDRPAAPATYAAMVVISVVALVAAAGFAVIRGTPGPAPDDAIGRAAMPLNGTASPAITAMSLDRYRGHGFTLRHPVSWTVHRRGPAVTLTAPDGEAAVRVAPLSGGSMRSVADGVMDAIERSYDHVDIHSTEAGRLGPHPAVTLAGRATDRPGERVRFLVVTVRAHRTWAVTAFTSWTADPEDVLPAIQAILDSFRPKG